MTAKAKTKSKKRARGARLSTLKAPFPWFGGKRRVAHIVWERFGNVPNYVEPFFGSGAVLLARPPEWPPRNETVNDIDCMVANFWRAIAAAPEDVAFWADSPVNEADLHAKHQRLHEVMDAGFIELMHSDPDHYDAWVAGWWVWGLSCWIGDGWCRPILQGMPDLARDRGVQRLARGSSSGAGIENRRPALKPAPGAGVHSLAARNLKRPQLKKGDCGVHGRAENRFEVANHPRGVHAKRPDLRKAGRGVNRKMPIGDNTGQGVHKPSLRGGVTASDNTRPSLHSGEGVHRKIPDVNARGAKGVHSQQLPDIAGNRKATGRGVHRCGLWRGRPAIGGGDGQYGNGIHAKRARRTSALLDYMLALHDRLRYVRVCCGNWDRILGPSPTTHIGMTAVFLDPPYGAAGRDKVYNADSLDIAAEVLAWCLDHGDEPKLRIALCGYAGEHEALEGRGWSVVKWKASGGYGARNKANRNAERERIWFSPHCLAPLDEREPLLAGLEKREA